MAKDIITILLEPIYLGDWLPSLESYQRVIKKYYSVIKKGEFYE